MRRTNGFKLGRRVVKLWRWVLRGRPKGYLRFAPSLLRSPSRRCCNPVAMTRKLLDWSRRCLARRHRPPSLSGGDDAHATGWDGGAAAPLLEEGSRPPPPPPKGHLAVYVGGWKDGGGTPPQRHLLPVIYFNHPLFGELLEEAAAEFGYQHPGGITIPCPVARFERVKTRIAAAAGGPCRKMARSQLSPGTHDHHS